MDRGRSVHAAAGSCSGVLLEVHPRVTAMTHRPKRFYRNSSPTVARAVRDLYFVGRLKQREIGRMFGLSQGNVSRIVSRQVWNVR